MVTQFNTLKSYIFPIILLLSILLGGLTGYVFNQNVAWLKPFGDIFLNLIFTTIVPLIFFSVSSAIARTGSIGKLGKIFYSMTVIFLFTGIVAAIYALFVVLLFPPAQNMPILLESSKQLSPTNLPERLIEIFTVPEFSKLFSHEHILALVLFSILVGLAVAHSKDKGTIFNSFLKAGEDVFMSVFRLIMY